MSDNWTTKLKNLGNTTGKLASASPDTMRAFGALATAATRDGALNKKTKELMACLLYTSPSPRDQRGSRMPSSA